MDWSLITCCNNDSLLENCLLKSPSSKTAREIKIMRGYTSASKAYNQAISECSSDILVFAHQDIYFPDGWEQQLSRSIEFLSETDPGWATLGLFGVSTSNKSAGHIYCTGLGRELGKAFSNPLPCRTLDEVVIILRRSSGLTFDDKLPGFHLYGTDICLESARKKLTSYIIPAFCVHNTTGMKYLPWGFWKSYFYLRRKWKKELPIKTPCTQITYSAWPVIDSCLRNFYSHSIKKEQVNSRVKQPELLCPSVPELQARVM